MLFKPFKDFANKLRHTRPSRRRDHRRRDHYAASAIERLEDRVLLAATIDGTVFHDGNGDGVQQTGEEGIAGITVFLDQSLNGVLDPGELSTVTDQFGTYQFAVPAGNYAVAQVLPDGWTQTAPEQGGDWLGEVVGDSLAPSRAPRGLAWADVDGSGSSLLYSVGASDGDAVYRHNADGTFTSFDTGSLGLLDITFDGTNFWGTAGDQIVHFDLVHATGSFNIIGSFQSPSGAGTTPWGIASDGSTLWVSDSTSDTISHIDTSGNILSQFAAPDSAAFGLEFDGQHLWTNGRDSGLTYEIDPSDGRIVRDFVTPHETPSSSATGLAINNDRLWIAQYESAQLSNALIAEVIIPPPATSVTVADGQSTMISFGQFALASLSGQVFEDANGDGLHQSGEGGLEGWCVYLDQDGDGNRDWWEKSTVTDQNGVYTIGGLRADSYIVSQVLREPGWEATGSSQTAVISMSGQHFGGLDFGNTLRSTGPVGPETLVNTTTAGVQGSGVSITPSSSTTGGSAVATDANGNSIIVWDGRGTDANENVLDETGIFGQRYNAHGDRLGGEFQINAGTSEIQYQPWVAMAADTGNFAVAWTTTDAAHNKTSHVRLYGANGIPLAGELTVSNDESSVKGIAMDRDGDFAVLLRVTKPNGKLILAVQRYDASGVAQGRAIEVADPQNINVTAAFAMDADGDMVVAWDDFASSTGSGVTDWYVYAQKYDNTGNDVGSTLEIKHTATENRVDSPTVAMDGLGNFAVTWYDHSTNARTLQFINADGTLRGASLSFAAGSTSESGALAIGSDGTLVSVWQQFNSQREADIYAQRFDIAAIDGPSALGDSFIVNSTIVGDQYQPAIAAADNGSFVVSWTGAAVDSDVFAQRYAAPVASASDVAVKALNAPANIVQGDPATIEVTVENQGTSDETFDVMLISDNGTPTDSTDDFTIDNWIGVTLISGGSTILSTSWDTQATDVGTHALTANAVLSADENLINNSMSATVSIEAERHDVAVTAVSGPSPVIVGDAASIAVTVENQGNRNESFSVTLLSDNGTADTADNIAVATWTVTNLGVGASQILTASWNTTGANVGVHGLTATVSSVATESDTADNSMSTTITVQTTPSGSANDVYVWDIVPVIRTRGNGGRITDGRISVTVHRDANANGLADSTTAGDAIVAGAEVTVAIFNSSGVFATMVGTTDSSGVFTSDWIKDLPAGAHAEVVGLTHSTLTWEGSGNELDPTMNDHDLDGDSHPDEPLTASSALLATTTGTNPIATDLTQSDADRVVAAAIAQWEAALGHEFTLSYEVRVADLPGSQLGSTTGNVITIDINAAGVGWFIDPSPGENSEFSIATGASMLLATGTSDAHGLYDLLTVAVHEVGHLLGFGHHPVGVMDDTLSTSTRRLVTEDIVRQDGQATRGRQPDLPAANLPVHASETATDHHDELRVELENVPVGPHEELSTAFLDSIFEQTDILGNILSL